MERCDFCGTEASQAGKIVTSGTASICHGCVEVCAEIVRRESAGSVAGTSGNALSNRPTHIIGPGTGQIPWEPGMFDPATEEQMRMMLDAFGEIPDESKRKPDGTLLDWIKARPGLYFGRQSLRSLFDFMSGYQGGCGLPGEDYQKAFGRIPDHFNNWAAYRTRMGGSAKNWCGMLIESTGCDERAFDLFFELLDEYENRRPTLVARVKNSPGKSWRIGPDRQIGVTYLPASIREIVTYTDDPGFFVQDANDVKEQRDKCFMRSLNSLFFATGSTIEQIEIVDHGIFERLLAENQALEAGEPKDGNEERPPD